MPSILFICTANQFRSPIAEAYFRQKLATVGSTDGWIIGSAGTWAPAILPAHSKAIEAARKIGLDISSHLSREVDAKLLTSTNLIVVMQESHKEAIEMEFPSVRGKVVLLGALAKLTGGDIPDPAQEGFSQPDATVNIIKESIDKCFIELIRLALEPSQD